MRIKIRMPGARVRLLPGDRLDLRPREAIRLVRAGFARLVEPETALGRPAPEVAISRRRRRPTGLFGEEAR